jgi:alkylhydroperoxidase/carboxymuconolactone decarboxylase family protein YurZ
MSGMAIDVIGMGAVTPVGLSAPATEICEVIIHVGHYAGWPTISNAVRQYTAVLEEDEAIKQGKKKKPTLV